MNMPIIMDNPSDRNGYKETVQTNLHCNGMINKTPLFKTIE